MPVIPIGYANVTFVFELVGGGREATSSIGIVPTPGMTVVEFGDTLNGMGNAFFDTLGDDLSNDWSLVRVDGVLGQIGGDVLASHSFGSQFNNPNTTETPNVAIMVEKRSSLGGRAHQGRMFIPGVPSDGTLANGSYTPAYGVTLTADVNSLLAAFQAVDGVEGLVILHSSTSSDDTPTPISALTLDSMVATQRRRLR